MTKAWHNELDQKQLSTKQRAIFEQRQTNIEVRCSQIFFSVFFVSIFVNFNSVLKGAGNVIRFKERELCNF